MHIPRISTIGAGLSCVAASCPALKTLSLAKNKQLQDNDFEIAFKIGFNNLVELDCSYNNITGQCFEPLKGDKLEKINLNCCSRLANRGLLILFKKCNVSLLRYLDISVTKISDALFSSIPNLRLSGLKTLYMDFCASITSTALEETLFLVCPCLKFLSIYGISVNQGKSIGDNI